MLFCISQLTQNIWKHFPFRNVCVCVLCQKEYEAKRKAGAASISFGHTPFKIRIFRLHFSQFESNIENWELVL
jgi:hypothetical protein